MTTRVQMETINGEGPGIPGGIETTSPLSVLPPVPKVAVVRL